MTPARLSLKKLRTSRALYLSQDKSLRECGNFSTSVVLLLSLFGSLYGCAGDQSKSANVGLSAEADHEHGVHSEEHGDAHEHGDPHESSEPHEHGEPSTDQAASQGPNQAPKPEVEPIEAELARMALKESRGEENSLSLAFAVSERASDLPWVLAIENRSSGSIQLAALPSLISLEITPKAETEEEVAADSTAAPSTTAALSTTAAPSSTTASKPAAQSKAGGKAKPASKEPKLVTCGDSLPKSVSAEERVTLAPGELLFHAFDPRALCEQESSLLAGSTVKVVYGFPILKKKVWKAGKVTETEVEQKEPFVALRKNEGEDEFVPVKRLVAQEFVLGKTYPLSQVTAFPTPKADPSLAEGEKSDPNAVPDEKDSADGTNAAQTRAEVPPPPLVLTISPLGVRSKPEAGLVTVKIHNQSGKSMKLFVRRELFTFEILGPDGGVSCQMQPAARHPDPGEFQTLSSGGSTSLVTRIAEICPLGTFSTPGTYAVNARFAATVDGSEYGLKAFTGSALSKEPAKLVIPGGEEEVPAMRVAPAR